MPTFLPSWLSLSLAKLLQLLKPMTAPSSTDTISLGGKPEMVNSPDHYAAQGSIECIEAIEAQLTPEEFRGFLKGNVAKYVWRERRKGGREDLRKAQWYLKHLVAFDSIKEATDILGPSSPFVRFDNDY